MTSWMATGPGSGLWAALPPSVTLEGVLAITAILLLLSVLASKVASRMGVPTLVVFVVVGMLAGSEGFGGIYFDDHATARNLGTLALVLILFAGGLDTQWRMIRPVLVPSASLATVGVAATAGLVAAFAHFALGFSWVEGLLLGAIVSSTDAAAVFGILRAQRVRLRRRLGPMIELESGSNDPMAVFLTFGVTAAIVSGSFGGWELVRQFFVQMLVGGFAGWALGRLAAVLINRLRLAAEGLYAALTISLALLAYAGTQMIGGNGFLAVYVAGVTLAARPFVHRSSLTQFHDGLAWFMQIAMFLVLGLLVFPSHLPAVAGTGLALAFFLIVVARPVAVWLALLPFRLRGNERAFVGWAGLRGAVPIILATIPLTAGVPNAELIFNVVFFTVLTSVLIQGSTVGQVARWLRVAATDTERPQGPSAARANMAEVSITETGTAVGRRVVDLGLPPTAMLVLLTRQGRSFVPQGSTVLQTGDRVMVASRKADLEELTVILSGAPVELS